jgi:hypothetical protein
VICVIYSWCKCSVGRGLKDVDRDGGFRYLATNIFSLNIQYLLDLSRHNRNEGFYLKVKSVLSFVCFPFE